MNETYDSELEEGYEWTYFYHRRAFSGAQKAAIYKRAKGKCEYCGAKITLRQSEFDHVHPFSKGGPTIIANGALACFQCNRAKKSKSEKPVDVAALFLRRVHKANSQTDDDWEYYLQEKEPIKYFQFLRHFAP